MEDGQSQGPETDQAQGRRGDERRILEWKRTTYLFMEASPDSANRGETEM